MDLRVLTQSQSLADADTDYLRSKIRQTIGIRTRKFFFYFQSWKSSSSSDKRAKNTYDSFAFWLTCELNIEKWRVKYGMVSSFTEQTQRKTAEYTKEHIFRLLVCIIPQNMRVLVLDVCVQTVDRIERWEMLFLEGRQYSWFSCKVLIRFCLFYLLWFGVFYVLA